MNIIFNKLRVFVFDENGGEIVEWALVMLIIMAIALAAYLNSDLANAIQSAIQAIVDKINSVT